MSSYFEFLGRAGVILFISMVFNGPENYDLTMRIISCLLIIMWLFLPFYKEKEIPGRTKQ